MKKINKFLIIITWLTLIYILYKLDVVTGNINNLNLFLDSCDKYRVIVFIILSTLRIVALIPSVVFMTLGGMMFNPVEAFALSLISILLSESLIYGLSKILVGSSIQNYLIKRYPKVYNLLLKSNTRILAIGILCPVAPSDAACFLAGTTGLKFKKYIVTVIVANMPLVTTYSLLGNSIMANNNITIIGIIILLIGSYSVYLWKKAQKI